MLEEQAWIICIKVQVAFYSLAHIIDINQRAEELKLNLAEHHITAIDWKTYYLGKNELSYILTLPVQRRNNFKAITKFWAIR